jgi:hypothetical protein
MWHEGFDCPRVFSPRAVIAARARLAGGKVAPAGGKVAPAGSKVAAAGGKVLYRPL